MPAYLPPARMQARRPMMSALKQTLGFGAARHESCLAYVDGVPRLMEWKFAGQIEPHVSDPSHIFTVLEQNGVMVHVVNNHGWDGWVKRCPEYDRYTQVQAANPCPKGYVIRDGRCVPATISNPAHADGDEWWVYSADLDAGGALSIWNGITAAAPPGFSFAHTGDVQYQQSFSGIVGANRVHVSGLHNGKWYNCVFTWSALSGWTSQSCVQQSSGGGSGTMHRQHAGGGFTQAQPGYVPFFRRLARGIGHLARR